MYHRINGLLGDLEHSIFGIVEHYYSSPNVHMEHAVHAMFLVLKNSVRKLQSIYYDFVLQRKLINTVQQNQDVLHFTSSVLVTLALRMNQNHSMK
jgi:uncharacterized protein (DUF2267 family)